MSSIKTLISKSEAELLARRFSLEIFHGKKILITGGTGMIGSYLVEAICSSCELQGVAPKEICLITRNNNYSRIQELSAHKYVTFSNSNAGNDSKFRGFEYLIHAASPASPLNHSSLPEMNAVNAGMLSRMITRDTERVLYISSGEIYGSEAPALVSEEYVGKIDQSSSRSTYPLAKIEAERIGVEICEKFGIDFRIVRLFHTFGPGVRENDGRSFADFLWQCARGTEPILFSKGEDIRTFLYTADAVAAILTIFLKDQKIGPINVGSEQPVTILDFAKKTSELSGQNGRVQFRIKKQSYVNSPNRIIVPNTLKLRELGWNQEVTLDESISKTLIWIQNQIT